MKLIKGSYMILRLICLLILGCIFKVELKADEEVWP